MYCLNCGNKLSKLEKFCPKCGSASPKSSEIRANNKQKSQSKEVIFCGFCGNKSEKSYIFCEKCGERQDLTVAVKPIELEATPKVNPTAKETTSQTNETKVVKRTFRLVKYVFIIILIIALVYLGYKVFKNSGFTTTLPQTNLSESTNPQPVKDVLTTPPTSSKSETVDVSSPEPKPTGTPTPKTSKSPKTKTEAQLCRTIKQFGEEKQCFKLSETTQLTVESRYGDCPVVAASNGTCDVGTVVIVPTDRGAVIKPCSLGGDIKYSVNGNMGGIIGGGEPSSLRNETCLTKSNNTNPYILNYFPPLSFLPNVVSDVRYLLPEIGVEVLDEYIN
jgi:hypothetical protein